LTSYGEESEADSLEYLTLYVIFSEYVLSARRFSSAVNGLQLYLDMMRRGKERKSRWWVTGSLRVYARFYAMR
jgi:hypothetical protein